MGNIFKAIGNFFRDVRSELKKVIYPSAKQVMNNTIIVLVAVLVVGAFIWAFDYGFSQAREAALMVTLPEQEIVVPEDNTGSEEDSGQEIRVNDDGTMEIVNPDGSTSPFELAPEGEGAPEGETPVEETPEGSQQ